MGSKPSPRRTAPTQGGGATVPAWTRRFDVASSETVFCMGPCLSRSLEAPLARAGLRVTSAAPEVSGLADLDARSVLSRDTIGTMLQELRWADGSADFPDGALVSTADDRVVDPTLAPGTPAVERAEALARRADVARYFAQARAADTVVITLGQVEGLRDIQTGALLAGPPPDGPLRERYVPDLPSFEECEASLDALIAALRPDGADGPKLVMALSPIPQSRTALLDDLAVVGLAGKALLRTVMARATERHGRLDYFPLFEASLTAPEDIAWRPDRRRVGAPLMAQAIQAFREGYVPQPTAQPGRKGRRVKARAVRLDPSVIVRREDIQIRPFDNGDRGGPDQANLPLHARLANKGRLVCRFPTEWSDEHEALPLLAGTYLYGGALKSHFGHVLVDSVSRLWAFDRSRHDGVVFARRGPGAISSWVYDILGQYGLRKKDVTIIDAPTRVQAVDFAPPGSTLGRGPTRAYLDWLSARPPVGRRSWKSFGRSLYLGRIHMAHKGTLLGESYFADLLAAEGFTYFEPERYRIQDQARALAEAERVVFLEGSGVYSIELLGSTQASFHMISRRQGGAELFQPHIEPRASFSLLGDDTALLRAPTRNGRPGPSGPSLTTAPETILDSMIADGLVPSQPFDAAAFRAATRQDAERHARGDAAYLASVLAWLDENGA